MKIDQSILNLKKRHIFNDFQKHRGNIQYFGHLMRRADSLNREAWQATQSPWGHKE